MDMKKYVIAIALAIIVVLYFLLDWHTLLPGFFHASKMQPAQKEERIETFEACVAAGNPVMESYPRQCRTASGRLFVEPIGNELEKNDLIRITYPRPGTAISSPLTIQGEARGTWFFEASFPVTLTDWDGLIIAEGYASAEGDWMTENFVPFTATLTFTKPDLYQERGTLILHKDNPSGLPEHDDALEIPVQFK